MINLNERMMYCGFCSLLRPCLSDYAYNGRMMLLSVRLMFCVFWILVRPCLSVYAFFCHTAEWTHDASE
jgi:hypothetical protein